MPIATRDIANFGCSRELSEYTISHLSHLITKIMADMCNRTVNILVEIR
jgi:hypothetical protein